MFQCTFILNDKPLSDFVVGGTRYVGGVRFAAFSGLGASVNKRASACHPDSGPIPPGRYYIFNRESGGRLGALRDWMRSDKEGWFSLYREDDRIDDQTICDSVARGNFRLHPKGAMGISKGCIVIEKPSEFLRLSAMLRSVPPVEVKGSSLKAFGIVTVS